VKVQQHGFIEEYTASENADLYALVFNVTRSRQFGDFDPKEMCKTLLKSVAFSGMAISIQYVEEWTAKMMDSSVLAFERVTWYDILKVSWFDANMIRNFHRRC
jgi:hypothetical protein